MNKLIKGVIYTNLKSLAKFVDLSNEIVKLVIATIQSIVIVHFIRFVKKFGVLLD